MEKINHPKHYNSNPSGIECIDVAKHLNFCMGNALKYIWRAGLKLNDGYHTKEDYIKAKVEDLRKAIWYLECEIDKTEQDSTKSIVIDKEKLEKCFNEIGTKVKKYIKTPNDIIYDPKVSSFPKSEGSSEDLLKK